MVASMHLLLPKSRLNVEKMDDIRNKDMSAAGIMTVCQFQNWVRTITEVVTMLLCYCYVFKQII